MKTLAVFFVLFCGLNICLLSGQNLRNKEKNSTELNEEAKEYCDKGDYNTAIFYSEKALEQAKVEYGSQTQNYATFLNNLAYLYNLTGNYSKAESLYLESLEIKKKALGEEHPDYATSINNLAELYRSIGNYAKAEPLVLQALEIRKKSLGEEHPDYATSLNNLAYLYAEMGDYPKAEPLYLKSLEIYKKNFGIEHLDYITTLDNLAVLYMDMGNISQAKPIYLKSIEIKKKKLGEEHPDYAISLNNLASYYSTIGDFSKAEPLFLQAVEIYRKTLGEEHPEYATALNNLALFYYNTGSYSKAEPLYLKTLEIYLKTLGEEHSEYAQTLNNLAALYERLGNFSKAEGLYFQTLGILKKTLGEEHQHYSLSLNNLGLFYYNIGNYSKAEPLYLQSIAITKKNLGEENLDYALSLNNLASLYFDIGNYLKAVPLYLKALEIYKIKLGEENPDYARTLNNLANLYNYSGNYPKAETCFLQALEIRKKVFGTENYNYAISLNNLALFYSKTENYSKAEPLYLQALEIFGKIVGEKHPDYGSTLANLAGLYVETENYSKAEPLFLQSLAITKTSFGDEHPDYALNLINLGILYFKENSYLKAEQTLFQARDIYINTIEKNKNFLSEEEIEKYTISVFYNFEICQNFCLNYFNQNPTISAEALTTELFVKGTLLKSGIQLRQNILSSGDTAANNIFNEWINLRKELAHQYSKPVSEQREVKEKEENANELEKQLTRISADFRKQKEERKITWQQIQEQILSNSAAIEFTSFDYYNKGWTDSTVYAALVLKKDAKYPEFIFQFDEKRLQTLLSQNKAEEVDELNQLYSPSSDSSDLYHLIWQPLEPYLQGVDKIYFSPSGIIHSIDLQAIIAPDGKRLGEKYNMVQMSTTRNVVTSSGEPDRSSIALFGGIDYDYKPAGKDSITNPYYDFHKPELTTANRGGKEYFPPLEETKKEIEQIQKQFEANKIQTSLITGAQATEEAFKSLSGKSPKILHISTHGFFFPDIEKKKVEKKMMVFEEDKSVFKISENPLLRSGLIMAHGNYAWQKGSNPYEKEDGILTAYEIANLNLSNTDLVVLSACETGLGEIKGSEGVFGLQRAFKMAGVDYLMMSLWKVPDKETKEFMQTFYSNWLGGMKIRDAFRNTQLTMSKTYPNDPYKWAAFVLVE